MEELLASLKTEEETCLHPLHSEGVCELCREENIDDESALPLSYIHRNLKITTQGMDQLRLLKHRNLLNKEKLCLVLDLDLTLVNTILMEEVSSWRDKCLLAQATPLKEADGTNSTLFKSDLSGTVTKLRPYVRTFLEKASKMYEIYLYTMGGRGYALDMVQLLDPKREYFGANVISGDDVVDENKKSLDVVMAPENVVVILDDTAYVWERHKDNLLLIEKYRYFDAEDSDFLGLDDENEADGPLAKMFEKLEDVHGRFFKSDLDVDPLTKDVRRGLRGDYSQARQKRKVL